MAYGRDRCHGARGRGPHHLPKDVEDPEKERTEEYRQKFANPFIAAGRGYIDDVIMPRNSRRRIARAFAMLEDKEPQTLGATR